MLGCLNAQHVNVLLCRYRKSQQDILVKLESVFAKIEILKCYAQSPASFTIVDAEDNCKSTVDLVYNKYCKYVLGISKYSSSTLALAELGKFPLSHKAISLSIAYWLRMEHGTENTLLNKAYNTMKKEQLPWLENIKCFLSKIGLNNIWQNPDKRSIYCVKKCVKERLNDMHLQKYHEYLCNIENQKKCEVINLCNSDQYALNEYLVTVKDPLVRSYITKLRIDANSTLDCKKRSFRYRNVVSDTCDSCNTIDNVKHKLLHCVKTSRHRQNFERGISQCM